MESLLAQHGHQDRSLRVRPCSSLDSRACDRWLGAVLFLYLILGALYAFKTPAWQVPDEPAHYNYVRYVAEHLRLPELRPGDFPSDYLEQIKSMRFPPSLSIAPLRYESHQPPLYYVLAAIVYWLFRGVAGDRSFLALRMFSLSIGGVTLMVGYRIVRRVYPGEPFLALGTSAFAAFLPMHLAMNAGVNNDPLAELMLALVVWQLLVMEDTGWTWPRTAGLGALLGLALLTKMQAYVAFGVALFALGWDVISGQRREGGLGWQAALARLLGMGGIALAVASPWLVRNMILYGWTDPLAMARHDQVVVGQLTTSQFVSRHGVAKLVRDLFRTTFNSFWGQFGWMGVPLPEPIYLLLKVLTALACVGFVLHLLDSRRRVVELDGGSGRGKAFMLVWAIGVGLSYLWYNTKYVQHQGRYLFPALVPWGLAFTLGLRTILRRSPILLLLVLVVSFLGIVIYWLLSGELKEYYIAVILATAVSIVLGHWLEKRRPGLALGIAYFGLGGLALVCLYAYIIPALQ